MNRQVFESMDDRELGWVCMAQIMQSLRGKSPTVKSQVYAQLTSGQQSLFMFYAYYNHAKNSLGEFYWWSAYDMAQPALWLELQAQLQNIGDQDFQALLNEIEEVLRKWNHPRRLESFDVSADDLENDSLLTESIAPLYTRFQNVTQSTLRRIGTYVRNNPHDFVQLVG